MTKIVMLCCIALFSLSYGQTREQLSESAQSEFLETNFFSNGEGMMLSADLMNYVDILTKDYIKGSKSPQKYIRNKVIASRYGFNIHNNEIVGLFNEPYKGMNIGVLGCVACHSGKAAGKFIVGLGNKTIDAYQVGADAYRIQSLWPLGRFSKEGRKIHSDAMHFAKVISDKSISNLTAGIVPVSVIMTFFYTDQGISYPKDLNRGQMKAPHLWGFLQKREAGVFAGGEMSGDGVAWEFGAELFGSNRGSHLKDNLPKLERLVHEVLPAFLPPKYPFKVDRKKAENGAVLFNKTCAKCHGHYVKDAEGYPIFEKSKMVPAHVAKTDDDRLKTIPVNFVEILSRTSVADVLSMSKIDPSKKGYLAPRLDGIWARFPYLHNASVPSVYDLLMEPESRPKVFSLVDIGEEYRFDQQKMGLKLSSDKPNPKSRKTYDVTKIGHSNSGHYFKTFKTYSHEDRMDIIEYLKTL